MTSDIYYREVPRFLINLGLSQYIENFERSAVNTLDVLVYLNEPDLYRIGIASNSDIRKCMSGIKALKQRMDIKDTTEDASLSQYSSPAPALHVPQPSIQTLRSREVNEYTAASNSSTLRSISADNRYNANSHPATYLASDQSFQPQRPPSYFGQDPGRSTPPRARSVSGSVSANSASNSRASRPVQRSPTARSVSPCSTCTSGKRNTKPNASFRSNSARCEYQKVPLSQVSYTPKTSLVDEVETKRSGRSMFMSKSKRFDYQKAAGTACQTPTASILLPGMAEEVRRKRREPAPSYEPKARRTKKDEVPPPGAYDVKHPADIQRVNANLPSASFRSKTPRNETAKPITDVIQYAEDNAVNSKRRSPAPFLSTEQRLNDRQIVKSTLALTPYYNISGMAEAAMRKGNVWCNVRSKSPRLTTPNKAQRQDFINHEHRSISETIARESVK